MKSNGELLAEIARLNEIIEEQADEITVFTIELRSLRVKLERQNEKESSRVMQAIAEASERWWSWDAYWRSHTIKGSTKPAVGNN